MSNVMLFCTSAEQNRVQYSRKIQFWNSFVKDFEADLYSFCDGNFSQQLKNKFSNITFVQSTPALGHHNHPGWRRSLRQALKVGRDYKYIMHIQNDVAIFNKQRTWDFITSGQLHAGWASDGQYQQTAIMTLNDKETNQKIIDFYSNQNNLFLRQCTQKRVSSFGKWTYDIVGNNIGTHMRDHSIRQKIKAITQLNVDYWGQFFSGYRFTNCADNYGFNYVGFR